MTLLSALTITGDGRVFVKAKNARDGKPNRYTYLAIGSFGSGTIEVQLSPDGTTWIDNIDNGSTLTFSAAQADNLEVASSENQPVHIGFNMTGSTAPSVTIFVYDSK